MIKNCLSCNIEKDLNKINFRICKYSSGKPYFKARCRDCERKFAKAYASEHKYEKKLYDINYASNNPNYRKEYKLKNRIKINKQNREKLKNEPSFKLRKNCSRAINRMLKLNNSSKNSISILKYLQYSIDSLKDHLEKMFDNNMSWENYGIYWHLDHIIPQSDLIYFSMEDQNFKKCWALENLRPYPAKQNMSDGATRVRHKKR